jgi:hypothetical protein
MLDKYPNEEEAWFVETLLTMNKINYLKGDATFPEAKGTKIICHICNDLGAWGKGFVLAISKRWSEPVGLTINACPSLL